ncbi:MAG: hypothetical protein ACRCSG_00920 [Cellulosilyticaceae bacterium]
MVTNFINFQTLIDEYIYYTNSLIISNSVSNIHPQLKHRLNFIDKLISLFEVFLSSRTIFSTVDCTLLSLIMPHICNDSCRFINNLSIDRSLESCTISNVFVEKKHFSTLEWKIFNDFLTTFNKTFNVEHTKNHLHHLNQLYTSLNQSHNDSVVLKAQLTTDTLFTENNSLYLDIQLTNQIGNRIANIYFVCSKDNENNENNEDNLTFNFSTNFISSDQSISHLVPDIYSPNSIFFKSLLDVEFYFKHDLFNMYNFYNTLIILYKKLQAFQTKLLNIINPIYGYPY